MNAIVHPARIKGIVEAPPSKSAMQRACAAALIRKGRTILLNPGQSADDKAALSIIRQLGAFVEEAADRIIIDSAGVQPLSNVIDAGESGLSARLFTSIAALSDKEIEVRGRGSLLKRPFHFFDETFPELGVTCKTNNGLLPLQIRGPLKPADIRIDGSLSSQYLTGLLMAYAALDAGEVTIEVDDLKSKPYIDLTLDILSKFGFSVPVNHNYNAFRFENTQNIRKAIVEFRVEGDWSGAAFLLVAGAISGEVIIKGLDVFSSQADKAVLQALMQTGAGLSIEENQVSVRPSSLKPFHFNATECPDLFPPLVALAAYCNGTTVIEGVHRLKHKESDRAKTLQMEMGKLGVEVTLQDDLMLIKGSQTVHGSIIDSHGDHRIAMAGAVAALGADASIEIIHAEAVDKSYPGFFNDLSSLGAAISLNNY